MQNSYPEDLPKTLWLLLPIVVALFPYVMRVINIESDAYVFGELGVIENFTFIVLVAAIISGLLAIVKMKAFEFPVFKL